MSEKKKICGQCQKENCPSLREEILETKNKSTSVKATTRKLKAKWTAETAENLQNYFAKFLYNHQSGKSNLYIFSNNYYYPSLVLGGTNGTSATNHPYYTYTTYVPVKYSNSTTNYTNFTTSNTMTEQ